MVDIYTRQFWKPTMKELLNFSVRANTPTALSTVSQSPLIGCSLASHLANVGYLRVFRKYDRFVGAPSETLLETFP